jgi:hypothetical protein
VAAEAKRRDVTTDTVLGLVGLHHHRQRVPADEALDAALDLTAAWERRLILWGNGVDVRGVGGEGLGDAMSASMIAQLA